MCSWSVRNIEAGWTVHVEFSVFSAALLGPPELGRFANADGRPSEAS